VKLVLASASPRRRDLLAQIGLDFDVRPVDIDETPGAARDPAILARRLAREKAEAARLLYPEPAILAADTVVWHEGKPLGKPRDAGEAMEMLTTLRGKTHDVITVVALMPAGKTAALFRHPVTSVTLRDYSNDAIAATIRHGHPFDKAGGYAIQDGDLAPVASYHGCYCNVIGLSLYATMELLRKADIDFAAKPDLLPECASCPLAR